MSVIQKLAPANAESSLVRFATYALALVLLVAPFRSSAGMRGALLLLAFIAVVVYCVRKGWSAFPSDRLLNIALGARAAIALLSCAWSVNALASLGDWRGEIATQFAAFAVAWFVARERTSLQPLAIALLLGLVALTIMLCLDPYNQFGDVLNSRSQRPPLYGGAGQTSVWIMCLLAVLPLWWYGGSLWRGAATPSPSRRERHLLLLTMGCIALSAVMVGNRTIWVGAATMLLVGGVLASRQRDQTIPFRWRHLVFAFVLLAVLLITSVFLRFNGASGSSPFSVASITQDNRWLIWRASWDLIQQQPWSGYGLGRDVVATLLIAKFSDPVQRVLFIQGHNIFLNAWLQMGVTGVLAALFLFAALLWRFLTMLRGTRNQWLIGACGLMLVVGVLVRNQMDDFLYRQSAILFFVLVGLMLGRADRLENPALEGAAHRSGSV